MVNVTVSNGYVTGGTDALQGDIEEKVESVVECRSCGPDPGTIQSAKRDVSAIRSIN